MNNNRKYVVFNVSELDKIDFTQVLETSAETLVRSVDGTKTFVKWEDEVPPCILSFTTKGEYLTTDEIVQLMTTSEWSKPITPVTEPVVA
jgi:hypothetical protein